MNNATVYADLDKIVFEGREKRYGAYELRTNYNRLLSRAMLITFLCFLSITGLPKVIDWVMPKVAMVTLTPFEPVDLDPIADVDRPEKEPEEKPILHGTPPPPPVRTVQFLVIKPVPDELVDDSATIASINDLDSAAVGLVNKDGDPGNGVAYNFDEWIDKDGGNYEFTEPKDTMPGSGTFVAVDREPSPVNLEEIKQMIGYPPRAVEAEIEGRVTVRILVSKTGDYVKHVVLKDPHPLLTKAVTDKVNLLKMTPGIQGVKPVAVWVTIPFEFELTKN